MIPMRPFWEEASTATVSVYDRVVAAQFPCSAWRWHGINAAMQTEPSKADPRKHKRRWFQFSLRTLLIFTVVVAVGAGWLGNRVERKRQEREAAEAIVKLGGLAVHYYEKGSEKSPGPDWVRSLLGENFFSDVVEVNLAGAAVHNSDLVCLDNLVAIEKLNLSSTKITDEGLASLARLGTGTPTSVHRLGGTIHERT